MNRLLISFRLDISTTVQFIGWNKDALFIPSPFMDMPRRTPIGLADQFPPSRFSKRETNGVIAASSLSGRKPFTVERNRRENDGRMNALK